MLKILLVDDEYFVREGLRAMLPLKELDLQITGVCANTLDALDSVADDMPDILLTDIKMPFVDGLEMIERALKLNPAMRCIVLSGYDEFNFAKQASLPLLAWSEFLLHSGARCAFV